MTKQDQLDVERMDGESMFPQPQEDPEQVCFICDQVKGRRHLSWCPVVTGRLRSVR
jgi:hypothetical protein